MLHVDIVKKQLDATRLASASRAASAGIESEKQDWEDGSLPVIREDEESQ